MDAGGAQEARAVQGGWAEAIAARDAPREGTSPSPRTFRFPPAHAARLAVSLPSAEGLCSPREEDSSWGWDGCTRVGDPVSSGEGRGQLAFMASGSRDGNWGLVKLPNSSGWAGPQSQGRGTRL